METDFLALSILSILFILSKLLFPSAVERRYLDRNNKMNWTRHARTELFTPTILSKFLFPSEVERYLDRINRMHRITKSKSRPPRFDHPVHKSVCFWQVCRPVWSATAC
jgi:hypothetical protein